jgi:hypothetical protein
MTDFCTGCGRAVEGGTAGCRAEFDSLVGRDFGDPRFFAVHRLFVDAYALQHPDEFCASAKSLAAHLVGLHLILDGKADPATGTEALRRWLDGPGRLAKPAVPADRGTLTLADLAGIDDPQAWQSAVTAWARDIWHNWRDLHLHAGQWAKEALGAGRVARS